MRAIRQQQGEIALDGRESRLTLEKLQYNVSLKDDDFTLQALRHQ